MAVYRAAESARHDALFKDPLAERLAGEHGRAIAAVAPRMARNGWWWVTRTILIDRLVAEAVGGGCDRVVNLAAGFDTRPYRLDLPSGIDWIEADTPELIAEKERLLADETPRCRMSSVGVDLADTASRRAFLNDALGGARNALVITEGLILYLDAGQVRGLAQDLHRDEIRSWITDLLSPFIVRHMMRKMPSLDRAPMKFGPAEGVAFFEREDWSVEEVRSIFKEAGRRNRLPFMLLPFGYLPDPNPRKLSRIPWSGVVQLAPRASRQAGE
ncbi:SAM-dependent methyltransferase [Mycolicibacter kumamotonensis]|uniref:S-adenosyl-L-methionine-dependent methyltransferase n=3 Tax=Mycobacteriaceae TaxID=1762 RepID=A0A1X1W6M6_MYCIR|nr:SAM-dependent methyltransferase [Mycolicibacter kumamotonensis]ORV82180.1 methyltransferase [Mycolicibacterium iranicum]